MSLQRSTATRGINSTPPPATAGAKRTSDGVVKNANNTLQIPDIDADEASYKPEMTKKLISNMRVYSNNIINELENISKQPERAYLVIKYAAQKMVVAGQMMEDIMDAPMPVEEAADTPRELSLKAEAAVERIVELKIGELRDDFATAVSADIMDGMTDMVAEAIGDNWEYSRSYLIDKVYEKIMGEDMTAVKDSVMSELKLKNTLGDMKDSQDQQRIMGVGDVIQ